MENKTSLVDIILPNYNKAKFLPKRRGERYASALTNINLSNKVHRIEGRIELKDYINNIVKNY